MNKTILVTGASSGIGAAVSNYLSQQGCYVILIARDVEKLNQAASELPAENLILPYDLSDLEHIEDIFIKCREKELRLDGMVHCAGINQDIPIRANDVEIMKNVTTINYYSFVEL